MLGNGRLEAMCFDGVKRLCHIRGKLRKKVWIPVQLHLSPRTQPWAQCQLNTLSSVSRGLNGSVRGARGSPSLYTCLSVIYMPICVLIYIAYGVYIFIFFVSVRLNLLYKYVCFSPIPFWQSLLGVDKHIRYHSGGIERLPGMAQLQYE